MRNQFAPWLSSGIRRAKVKRRIVGVEYFRTSNHPKSAGDSVFVTLECGHSRRYKASESPKKMMFAFCTECKSKDRSC